MKIRLTMIAALLAGSVLAAADTAPFAYHLRVVRVSPSTALPGAALGWSENGGAPVLLPDDEAWGTSEQLEALAEALGGDRAEAVTGFYVQSGADGVLHFDRKAYAGESVLRISLRALPPATSRGSHDVTLTLSRERESAMPLAEAKVRIATDRTVAIAAPADREGEWIVLALTPLEPGEAEVRVKEFLDAKLLDGDGITMPRLLTRVEPEYPRVARDDRLTGRIVTEFILDRDGIPRAPMVLSMTPGGEELAGAAVEAVKQWRYEPASLHGEPVAVRYNIVVVFALE